MFNFTNMLASYDVRAIDRYDEGDLFIDTCAVSDSEQPYETAVAHPAYNGGKLVIVEMYDSVELAENGHQQWVEKMTAKTLPDSLRDVSTARIASLGAAMARNDDWRVHARQEVMEEQCNPGFAALALWN